MKKGIHPENYRLVVMKDMSTGYSILTKSTAPSKENVRINTLSLINKFKRLGLSKTPFFTDWGFLYQSFA